MNLAHRAMVLIVAPDLELRRSIEFLLEAEGLEVVSRSELPEALDANSLGRRCAIVDEDAIEAFPGGWERVADVTAPVILLVDRLREIPELYQPAMVRKPLLGSSLVDAVRAAIA